MSRAIGLVKFPNGNIYISCYDGTSDYMYSPLITKTNLTDNYNGDLFGWNDYVIEDACSETEAALDAARKDNSEETVEIYSDYGGGFWWSGKASEKHMCITEENSFWYVTDYQDGCPNWAQEFMDEWFHPSGGDIQTTPIREDTKGYMQYLEHQAWKACN